MTGFNLESHFATYPHVKRCKDGQVIAFILPCVSDREVQERIDSDGNNATNYVPIGPGFSQHGARDTTWAAKMDAAYYVRQREEFADAAAYIAVAVAVVTILYYVRPIWHGVRQAAVRFRAWLNAYGS